MIYEPRATSRFRKDLKQLALGDMGRLLKITAVMQSILDGGKLANELRPHKLSGKYQDCWECHIEPDLLLIWRPDRKTNVVTFVGLGRHTDLFT